MKPTQITAKQYLWDQLDKHIVTDPLEDILKQWEDKNIQTTHTQILKNQIYVFLTFLPYNQLYMHDTKKRDINHFWVNINNNLLHQR